MMNKSFLLLFLVFVTGFCMKFFRLPFHTIIMAAGAFGLLIIGILYFIAKDKEGGLLSLTTSSWCFYLISVVKFLPQTYFLTAAILISALTLSYLFMKRRIVLLQAFAPILVFLTATIVALQPADERYYLFNIKYNHHIGQDYWAWDKYSWFLNLAGKHEEAHSANNKAYSIVAKTDDEAMKELILMHQQKLRVKEWRKFR